jgi:hypothetical protein
MNRISMKYFDFSLFFYLGVCLENSMNIEREVKSVVDIKPENILIGKYGILKLGEFSGLSGF